MVILKLLGLHVCIVKKTMHAILYLMGLVTCGVILVYTKNFILWLTEDKKTLVLERQPIIEGVIIERKIKWLLG